MSVWKDSTNRRPPYEEEEQACRKIFEGILAAIERENEYSVNEDILIKAYETARDTHGDQRRISGDLYLRHPLATMESLARLHCKSTVLAAALLHDTMEDCGYTFEQIRENFSYEVATIVDAVTRIKKEEKEEDQIFQRMNETQRHDHLDSLTDVKLLNNAFQREAIMVRLADREHNLATLHICTPEKRRLKIDNTRAVLIPLARAYGMRYFETVLNDYCMKFDDPDLTDGAYTVPELADVTSLLYRGLKNLRNEMVFQSSNAFSRFEGAMQEGINAQSFFRFATFNPLAKAARNGTIKDGFRNTTGRRRILLPSEIARQLNGKVVFSRQDAYLNEMILTSQSVGSKEILSQFIYLYRKSLHSHGITLEYDDADSNEKDSIFSFVLTDDVENQYRVLLIPEMKIHEYFTGKADSVNLKVIGEEFAGDVTRPKITVYARGREFLNGERQRVKTFKEMVPCGATALDFAFIVKPALAFTAKAAWIEKFTGNYEMAVNEKGYQFPLSTVLHDGDVVKFDCDYHDRTKSPAEKEHAELSWLNMVNTVNAREKLVRYFQEKYEG